MINSFQKDLLKNISSWFEILEEMSKNTTDTSSLPKLEVSLRSGRIFSGSVIGLKKSLQENLLMLLEQVDLHSKARLHLIQCEDISAISFVDPMVYLSIFDKPTISELELKRKVKSIEEQITQITSSLIPISVSHNSIAETDRSHVLKLTEELPSIFETIIRDKIGKTTLSEHISSIEIQVAEQAKTSLHSKVLTCIFKKDSEVFLSKQKESLMESIEKVL